MVQWQHRNKWRHDDIRKVTQRRRLGLSRHVARLQPEVPTTSVLPACCAASEDTPPQPGWRRPRGKRRICWLHQVCTDLTTFRLLALWMLPLIGPHGKQSQRLSGYELHDNVDDGGGGTVESWCILTTSFKQVTMTMHLFEDESNETIGQADKYMQLYKKNPDIATKYPDSPDLVGKKPALVTLLAPTRATRGGGRGGQWMILMRSEIHTWTSMPTTHTRTYSPLIDATATTANSFLRLFFCTAPACWAGAPFLRE